MSEGSYTALARYYDAFTQNMDYKKRTEYICTLLCNAGLRPGATVLDLACGTGTYSRALAARGYDVVGIDASPDMLSVAREKHLRCGSIASPRPVTAPLLLCQRLENLDLYGTAQGAVCLTDSLNHLTEPARVRRFFRRLALFLEPGSPFIFDANTPYKHEHVLADNTFIYEHKASDGGSGAFCAWQNRWIPDRQITEIRLDIFSGDSPGLYARHQESFAERAYALDELRTWLHRAGFTVEAIHGELTTDPPKDDSQRAVFVCRRL